MVDKVEIPDKATFKIGEVAKLLELEPYVLRYWETEFEQLQPKKTRSGQRVYKTVDIEQLIEIRDLLYVEQFTIAGARRQLELAKTSPEELSLSDAASSEQLRELEAANDSLRGELEETMRELSLAQERERALLLHTEEDRVEREEMRAQLEQLERELGVVVSELEEKSDLLARYQADESARDGVDAQWEVMTSQLGDDVERLELELETFQHQVITLSSERDMLIAEREQLEARCEEYVTRLHSQHQGKGRLLELLKRELVGLNQLTAN